MKELEKKERENKGLARCLSFHPNIFAPTVPSIPNIICAVGKLCANTMSSIMVIFSF